jgi:hypothetical protein
MIIGIFNVFKWLLSVWLHNILLELYTQYTLAIFMGWISFIFMLLINYFYLLYNLQLIFVVLFQSMSVIVYFYILFFIIFSRSWFVLALLCWISELVFEKLAIHATYKTIDDASWLLKFCRLMVIILLYLYCFLIINRFLDDLVIDWLVMSLYAILLYLYISISH